MKNIKVSITIKKVLGVVLFLVLLATCTFYVMRTLKDKGNYLKYVPFYEEEEQFDVLFFGSSRMLDGVYPMELWDEYGLTSYNMAQHSEGMRTSYWQMKNAFAHNTPKVAVVDLSLLHGGKISDEDEEMKSYLHKSLDHMPFGKIKYDALVDLTEGIDVWEYLFPFAMYHNRWNELERSDFYLELPVRKGAEARVAIKEMEGVEWSTDAVAPDLNTTDIRLDDMVALCEEHDVQLVLTLMPAVGMSASQDICATMNAIAVYAEERGIPFVNFAKEDEVINYAVDFHDASHLNPSGAKKISKALGEFLVGNYEFEAKAEETIEAWEASGEDYMGTKLGEMIIEQEAGNAAYYLLLLNDNDFTFEIRMPDASYIEAFGLETILSELEITEEDIAFDMTEEAMEITVYRRENGEYFHSAMFTR